MILHQMPYHQLPLVLAIIMDLFLGDPEISLHPVRIIGNAIQRGELLLRRLPISEGTQGALLAVIIPVAFGSITFFIERLSWDLSPMFGASMSAILLYWCIAIRSLGQKAMEVEEYLEKGQVEMARERLSRIVGRDVNSLDARGMRRGAVESVAENLTDAVIAPIFWYSVGGAWLAFLYRSVNTLDAMVGYKNERYMAFGRASARLDDCLNFLPARLAVISCAFAGAFLKKKHPLQILKMAFREGRGHESPNSGLTEAAFAQTLDIRLGGPTAYPFGISLRPFFNKDAKDPGEGEVKGAVLLMHSASLVFVIFVLVVKWALAYGL